MKNTRMNPELRKTEILAAALILASSTHYLQVTRAQIAEACGISGPAVQYHFKTMGQLRTQLMRAAVKRECLPVLAQGMLGADAHALRAPQELKDLAWATCAIQPDENKTD